MRSRSRRAAHSAASLTRLARSAPLIPVVCRASPSRLTSSCRGVCRVCTRRMACRPARSGSETLICRSKRPGRSRAGSRISARFVAASTTMVCRAAHTEERPPRFAGHGFGQQGFARTRRTHQQSSSRDPCPQALKAFGSAQELHELFNFPAHFVDARDISEGDRRWFQFWTNGRRCVLMDRPAPGRGATAGCPWRLGGSSFGCGTLPEAMDVPLIAKGAGGTHAPVREQHPYQHQQEEEERKRLPEQREPGG